jgi:hypothetical protein
MGKRRKQASFAGMETGAISFKIPLRGAPTGSALSEVEVEGTALDCGLVVHTSLGAPVAAAKWTVSHRDGRWVDSQPAFRTRREAIEWAESIAGLTDWQSSEDGLRADLELRRRLAHAA